ncbi:MAG: T9SS type A sorting domain-containing protein, partial [Lentimicrobium sp.]|nr:T9SS type A sorting domain-containing protein [Lentimicrobium sp.]
NRSFTGYAVFLDGILQGNTFDTSFVFEPLVYGQSYLAGVAAVYTSGYSEVDTCRFTSGFLFPPQNLTAETLPLVDYSFLTWEAPENPQYPGQAVPGLTAYRIYRNQQLIAEVASDTTEFYDLNLPPARYSYEISAVYDLTSYGFPSQTGESMKTGPEEVHIIYGYELPFTENFNAGLFETNQWTVEGTNWRIAGQAGNPAPAVEFYFSPVQMDYSFSLTSYYINGLDIIDGKIMLDFDLKLTLVNATEEEKLAVEVFNGSAWIKVAEYKNTTGLNWVNKSIDITEQAKNRVFRIRFTASGNYTTDIFNWLIDNVNIYRSCEPVRDLYASVNLPNLDQVILIWEAPWGSSNLSGWLVWDNGDNEDAIGLQGGGAFYAAVRFTPAQLAQYAGTSLTKIRMFPYGPNGSLILKVWTGSNAGTLALSQAVATYLPGEWNEFTLNTPVAVTGYEELWFGYEVTHTSNDYVAGCDKGPALAGFGDMISLDGSVWESMATQYSLNYNWNIQGYVEATDGSVFSLGSKTEPNIPNRSNRVQKNHTQRELLGYNIYREGVYIATTQELSFVDGCHNNSGYVYTDNYGVSALYEDCESEQALTGLFYSFYCPPIGVSYELTEDLKIYPNPSSGLIYVDTRDLSGSVQVYSFSGKLLLDRAVAKNEKPVLWLHDFPDGAYLVKFVSVTGETLIGKVLLKK